MTVTGRVLDPDGKPAAGVPVDIVGVPRAPETGTDVRRDAYVVLGQGATDGDGRFRIEASRGSSARFHDVYALAGVAGPGSGFGSVKLASDAEQPAAEIRLRPEQVIRGRLVDVNGQPAAGVEVQLDSVYARAVPGRRAGVSTAPAPAAATSGPPRPTGLRAWPKSVTTDDQGRFVVAGVGRGLFVSLSVRDPRFAQQRFDLEAGDRDAAKEVTLALQPARSSKAASWPPTPASRIPDAVISVRASFGEFGGMVTTRFRADDQGRFQINPSARATTSACGPFPPRASPTWPGRTNSRGPRGRSRRRSTSRSPAAC